MKIIKVNKDFLDECPECKGALYQSHLDMRNDFSGKKENKSGLYCPKCKIIYYN